jgi:phosphoglycerate dehydrogenase-like enzyme
MMLKIAVIDDYTGRVSCIARWAKLDGVGSVEFFSDHLADERRLAERLAGFDVIVAERERTPFPRTLLERLPRLRLLVATGPVNWSIDYAAAAERGIHVCGTEARYDVTPEFTWALILGLARRVVWEDRALRGGAWQVGLGSGLTGMTLGIVGLGNIGTKVATIGKVFGMDVVAWSQNLTSDKAASAGVRKITKEELLVSADYVSIHVVLSDRTRGLIGPHELSLMKKSAYLINTSRGPIVDEAALIEALAGQHIAGAALDVFDVEPLPSAHPLRAFENVILTPHLGYVTAEQYELFYGQVIENILAFAHDELLRALKPS